MSSRNMASVLALAVSGALVGVGCAAAQPEDPAPQASDEQQLAAPSEETATTAGDENVGEAQQAWGRGGWGGWGGGGWGGWGGGWPGWGGGWGGWGGYPGWGGWGWGYPGWGWGGWW